MQQHSTEEKVTEKCLSAFKPRQSSVDLLTLFIRGEWTNNAMVPPNNYLGFFHSASECRSASGLLYNTAESSKDSSLLSFWGGLMYILEDISA